MPLPSTVIMTDMITIQPTAIVTDALTDPMTSGTTAAGFLSPSMSSPTYPAASESVGSTGGLRR